MKDRRCLSQVWVYVYWGCWLDACPPGWLPSGGMGSHVVWPGSGVPVLCAKARKMSAEEQRNRRRYGGAERERERENELSLEEMVTGLVIMFFVLRQFGLCNQFTNTKFTRPVQSRPRPLMRSTDVRSTRMYGQFLAGPDPNGHSISKLTCL